MSNYLAPEEIYELGDAITSGGLNNRDARDALLMNINRGFVANLPERRSAGDQILSDLDELNGIAQLAGGEVPLKIWLENGVHRMRRSARAEQTIFQKMLDLVAEKSQKPDADPAPTGLERVIHADDLLRFGWLRDAIAVGGSVARLTVPRYESGRQKFIPGSDQPDGSRGTGWLIGPRHVITNHHVINSRADSEPLATESDLVLQARGTEVQFDYDSAQAAGTVLAVESLEAWYPYTKTPALDFAILKLKEPCSRQPLAMAPDTLQDYPGRNVPVNIIQHPGGEVKAIGIRNNLTTEQVGEYELRYFTDTMHGSSGSPVCNDKWQVVAMHRAEYRMMKAVEFQGKSTAWANRGVRIDRILTYLKDQYPDLLKSMGAVIL